VPSQGHAAKTKLWADLCCRLLPLAFLEWQKPETIAAYCDISEREIGRLDLSHLEQELPADKPILRG